MKDQSLHSIMLGEDQIWLSTIVESSDVAWLIQQENEVDGDDRKAIIKARIENINFLGV